MSVISPLSREVSAKIVYYGPGLSGKTTSLQYIHRAVKPERRGELVSLATETDRTIFFDFLPVQPERVRGMSVRFQLYTGPGQVFYGATRKLVLNGADGVVFVADSQELSRDANLESLEGLRENLQEMGLEFESFPLVFQYNKRDLTNVMDQAAMEADMNAMGAPAFGTSATAGDGVLLSLKEITRAVVRSLWKNKPSTARDRKVIRAVSERPQASIVGSVMSLASMRPQEGPAADSAPGGQVLELVGPASEAPSARPAATTAPPPVAQALSFGALWPEQDAQSVRDVEERICMGDQAGAVLAASAALAELLQSLPGPDSSEGPAAKATLVGLDGREYLRLCRLATLPVESISHRDALFALHMLVSARIKVAAL